MIRIMIVDDMPIFLEYLRGCIDWKAYGFEICGEAHDGREALEKLGECRPDVVLTDITMPYLNGLELADRIISEHPDISVILITGNNEFEYARAAVRIGVCDYIVKPFEKEELILSLLKLQDNILKAMENTSPKSDDGVSEVLRSVICGGEERDIPEPFSSADAGYLLTRMRIDDEAFFKNEKNTPEKLHNWQDLIARMLSDKLEIDGRYRIFRDREGNIVVLMAFDQIEDLENYKGYEFTDMIQIINSQLQVGAAAALAGATDFSGLKEAYEAAGALIDERGFGRLLDQRRIEGRMDGRSRNVANAAKEYIDANYADGGISVADISEKLGVNQTYLRKMFKSEMDMTLTEYITSVRLEEAKRLLTTTDEKLTTIAEMVGYSDVSYFSNVFKKHFGVSPRSVS